MRGVYTRTQPHAPEVSMQTQTKRYERQGGSISLGPSGNNNTLGSPGANPMRKRGKKRY